MDKPNPEDIPSYAIVHNTRTGENSFSLPLHERGAARRAVGSILKYNELIEDHWRYVLYNKFDRLVSDNPLSAAEELEAKASELKPLRELPTEVDLEALVDEIHSGEGDRERIIEDLLSVIREIAPAVWREGYEQGVEDARTAETLRVDAGVGVYAQPNRSSPYSKLKL